MLAVNGCDCKTQSTKKTEVTKKEKTKNTADVYTQARQLQKSSEVQTVSVQQTNTCSGGGLLGGLFGALAGIASFAFNGAASLVSAANSGGTKLGDLWLASKLMKNNNHCCGGHYSSRPVIVNNYVRPPLVSHFVRPMPHSFCWKPNNIAFDGPGIFRNIKGCPRPFGRNVC